MKNLILAALVLATIAPTVAMADQRVSGYTRRDGTYVAPYTRSSPDNSYNNNYSTQGNTNPYTGQAGTNPRTFNDQTPTENRQQFGNPGYSSGNSFGNR